MKLIFFTYLLLSIELVLAQNPCRVNVIFGLDASNYAASDGDSAGQAILFNEISNLQSTYRSWTISSNSVRAAIPRPMGCSQGGNWTLQDDVASLDNVVNGIRRFVYTCFQPFSLSNYIQNMNKEILENQKIDTGVNYVFVIFTSTTDSNDVQQAISWRQKYFDPLGYGLVIVRVKPPIASNLAQLQTFGIFDLSDPTFIHDITSSVCRAPPTTPYYCPSQFKANVLFELDVTDCTNFTASQEVKKVLSIINSWTIGNNAYKLNLPDPIGLVNLGMDFGNYTAQNSTVYSTLQSFIVGASEEAPCLYTESIISFLRPWYYSVVVNKNYPDFGIPHPIILFTRTSQPNDVSGAIAYRKQNLDPYNVRLYVVSVNATANLTGLASNGIAYDINDPNLSNYINGDICSTPGLLPPS